MNPPKVRHNFRPEVEGIAELLFIRDQCSPGQIIRDLCFTLWTTLWRLSWRCMWRVHVRI